MQADLRHYPKRMAHALCLWVGLVALVLAPLVLTQTQAPTSALGLELAEQHGHAHEDSARNGVLSHDGADHEHPVIAILPAVAGADAISTARVATNVGLVWPSLPPQAVRRPPRQI